jgi:hypothetical protein
MAYILPGIKTTYYTIIEQTFLTSEKYIKGIVQRILRGVNTKSLSIPSPAIFLF